MRIRLNPVNSGLGAIAVGVFLQQYVLSPFTEDWSYPFLGLEGFGVEQSHLPMFANQIDAFLRETGINVEHPMV